MRHLERRVAQEARAVTKKEVMSKAIEGRITWLQAANILGMTPRHIRRLRRRYEREGVDAFRDQRGKTPRRKRIPMRAIQELYRLRRERYADFSVKHFWEFATEKHGLKLSYNWTRIVLQAAGLAEKTHGRGKYRRKRERRPYIGMLLHLDASTHEWIEGLPRQDLVVMLDDADGRILFAYFFEQEGTVSTLAALHHVLTHHGRFGELYTDRGSHFCRTPPSGQKTVTQDYDGQVPRALRALGIRQILARSPQARGRSERAFGTIQGRLPQELKLHDIKDYPAANRYLTESFLPDFNRRFTVRPMESGSGFVPLAGVDVQLLLSVQHERIVNKDNTVAFKNLALQLPQTDSRIHFVRCPVLVHELLNATLAVSYQGQVLARFDRDTGELLARKPTDAAHRSAA
jgi:transposase